MLFRSEKFGRDSIWETHLATQLRQTDVTIDAVLEQQTMSLRDVMALEVGSQIMFDATPESLVELRCGDRTMFLGRMGRRGSRIAVSIEAEVPRGEVP